MSRDNDGGLVLHAQKVAGISGSEAYLLQLLPDLRERGWDVRFLMLHEDEPGAWEFARELTARGVPLDDVRLRADVDPIAFGEVVAYLTRARPRILHTHLVHADVYGQLAGSRVGARQKQVGHVGAAHQKDEANDAEQEH